MPLRADDKPATSPPVPDEMLIGAYHDYKGCKLIKVEADGITISHSLGIAKILFTDLPPDMRKGYGYDPVAAKKALAEQAAKNAASDAAAEKLRVAQAQTKMAIPISPPIVAVQNSNSSQIQSQIASLQGQITELQKEADALDASKRQEFDSIPNIYQNSTHQTEHHYTMGHSQQADQDRAEIADLQVQIAKLQSQIASK